MVGTGIDVLICVCLECGIAVNIDNIHKLVCYAVYRVTVACVVFFIACGEVICARCRYYHIEYVYR